MTGVVWAIAIGGMLLVLLAVFVRHLVRSNDRGWRLAALGLVIGLGIAGLALLLHR